MYKFQDIKKIILFRKDNFIFVYKFEALVEVIKS